MGHLQEMLKGFRHILESLEDYTRADYYHATTQSQAQRATYMLCLFYLSTPLCAYGPGGFKYKEQQRKQRCLEVGNYLSMSFSSRW